MNSSFITSKPDCPDLADKQHGVTKLVIVVNQITGKFPSKTADNNSLWAK